MSICKSNYLAFLQKNFIRSSEHIISTLIYSRSGIPISRFPDNNEDDIELIYGGITSLLEDLISRIGKEFGSDTLGGGAIEERDYRVFYFVAGKYGILFCICDKKANIDKIFMDAYFVCQKVVDILSGNYDAEYSTLEMPSMLISEDSLPVFGSLKSVKDKILKKFKIIILGAGSVGKTSLIRCYLKKTFSNTYLPTIGVDLFIKKLKIQDSKDYNVKLNIWDLAGQTFYNSIRVLYFSGADCAFIVYDITRRETFLDIKSWYDAFREYSEDIPVVLIGNKTDCTDIRQVSTEEGKKLAKRLNCSFYETSALEGMNVGRVFENTATSLFSKSLPFYGLNLKNVKRITCPLCGAVGKDIKIEDDKNIVIDHIDYRPVYSKRNVCKKCQYEF